MTQNQKRGALRVIGTAFALALAGGLSWRTVQAYKRTQAAGAVRSMAAGIAEHAGGPLAAFRDAEEQPKELAPEAMAELVLQISRGYALDLDVRNPVDPWGKPYVMRYLLGREKGKVSIEVVSAGPDQRIGTKDDVGSGRVLAESK